MPINTTSGAVPRPGERVGHVVNTADIYEPAPEGSMRYVDEDPEVAFVLPGQGWEAMVQDDAGVRGIGLVAWVALDDGRMYGVVVGESGTVDLNDDIEDHDGFSGYRQSINR